MVFEMLVESLAMKFEASIPALPPDLYHTAGHRWPTWMYYPNQIRLTAIRGCWIAFDPFLRVWCQLITLDLSAGISLR
jgi:hypothetical protein